MSAEAEIGVIGGSGFYDLDGLTDSERVQPPTPFGAPSSPLTIGTLHERRVAFLARHDEGHRLLPGELPSHANIYALKLLGVQRVIAFSAVGSLQQHIEPLHAVVPDQIIDRTGGRRSSGHGDTFFGDGLVAHIGFADPFCPDLGARIADAGDGAGAMVHRGGTLVVIDGPAFSTRAESQLYRSWDAAVIGMTALPEAKLAREAELCYATICFSTDYDVWHAQEQDVTAELIFANLGRNAEQGCAIVNATIAALDDDRHCQCADSLATSLVTTPEQAPLETRRRFAPLLERYWGPAP